MLWPIRGSAREKAGRQRVAGIVRSKASQAIPRRDRARQLHRPRGLPVLRMRQDSQKRQEARRGAEILLRGCGRSFNPLTGTLLYSRKIPLSEWVEFLLHLFEFNPVKTSARDNRNAERSGKYWLTKVFSALDGKELLVASEWRSKPAKRSTLELFGKHITPRPTLVYDGDNSHRGLIEALGLESEVHDKLKRFLRSHGGCSFGASRRPDTRRPQD